MLDAGFSQQCSFCRVHKKGTEPDRLVRSGNMALLLAAEIVWGQIRAGTTAAHKSYCGDPLDSLPPDILRLLILPQPHKPAVPQMRILSPLHELELSYEHRL